MSQPSPESEAALARASRAGRIARLTLKEMRETLRDRRTLGTLVLMPFLLYPLLSLMLRKFLLTGLIAGAAPTFYLTFHSERDAELMSAVLDSGRQLLAARQRLEPLPNLVRSPAPDPEEAIRSGMADAAIRVTRFPPEAFRPGENWTFDCEVIFVQGSANGELAARHIEDCCRAAGNVIIAQQLRAAKIPQRPSPVRVARKRLENVAPSSMVSLSALVPFVLILMTITGAVYPAIDLTAGERERGTLELLIAAPVPRLGLLFAKYVAVLTVAMLTATVNILAMTGTILFSGLGPLIWGPQGISLATVAAIFALMLLLASFFAAVLLTITSFARSFKEAQAYLIPLMLCALGPGLVSLMPGVQLQGWLVVTPLLNVGLLARDVLEGQGSVLMAIVVVVSTLLYAFAALAIAAQLFAADAVLYDARLGWAEIWRRPERLGPAGISTALLCLACMFPISFAANGAISTLANWSIQGKLVAMVAATAIVFGGVPLVLAYWRRVPWDVGFRWRLPAWTSWIGAAMLGVSLWPLAHEITVATQYIGLVTLDEEQFARAQDLVRECRQVPVLLVLAAFALAPALFEEFCFRGFVFGALRSRLRPWPTILASGALFGIFHLVATSGLAIERLVPSSLLGFVLGWVCYRTGSLFPGMLVHALHNGFLTLLFYYLPELQARGWGVKQDEHLPTTWLAGSVGLGVVAVAILYLSGKRRRRTEPGEPAVTGM